MAKGTKAAKTAAIENDNVETSSHYQEWRCEVKVERNDEGKVTRRTPEKVKMLRPVVKITDREAETLNSSALNSPRQDYVLMYFKPGEDA